MCSKKKLAQITAEVVKEVSENIYPTFINDLISELRLEEHEVLTLYGVARSIVNQDTDYTQIDDAYEEHLKGCEEYQKFCEVMYYYDPEHYDKEMYVIKPVSKKRFGKHLGQLTLLNLIILSPNGNESLDSKISLIDISAARFTVLLKKAIRVLYSSLFNYS